MSVHQHEMTRIVRDAKKRAVAELARALADPDVQRVIQRNSQERTRARGLVADAAPQASLEQAQPEKEKVAEPKAQPPSEITQMLQETMDRPAAKSKLASPVSPLFSEASKPESRRAKAWLEERIASSKKLPSFQLHAEVVSMSPALAEIIMLQSNEGNRAIKTSKVAIYEEAIRQGRWRLTSQGISFSRDGHLNNGQHRLSAIIAAGCSVPMMVTFGEDRDAFDVIDAGLQRGGSDALHVAGYKNTATLAAAVRVLLNIEKATFGGRGGYSNDIIKATVARHPRLEDATTMGAKIGVALKTSQGATTTAVFLITRDSRSARRLDTFAERLVLGTELTKGDPILVLREGLRNNTLGAGHRNSDTRSAAKAAAIIKAWNQWVRGRRSSPSSLSWSPDKPFPTVE